MLKNIPEILEVADIHQQRILLAQEKIGSLFPFDAENVKKINEDALAWIDLWINRFGKLQDIIGSKLIDSFLALHQEPTASLTMIDKLNKLERLGVIKVELWSKMKDARNHVAHEYPNEPALTAFYLNEIAELTPELLKLYQTLKNKILKLVD